MKLEDCTYGRMVIMYEDLKVGHIVGLTYNVPLDLTHGMSNEDKLNRTIPLVQFPDGTRGVHPGNLKRF